MLRLLKWMAIAAMVYVLYEIVTSLTGHEPIASVAQKMSGEQGDAQNPRGTVHGKTVAVHESDGGEHRQMVGRGVLH